MKYKQIKVLSAKRAKASDEALERELAELRVKFDSNREKLILTVYSARTRRAERGADDSWESGQIIGASNSAL